MNEIRQDSLAIRARRLAALARARSQDQQESQTQGQVETALRKLNSELGELESVLTLHALLLRSDVPVGDLPGLAKPAERLRDQVRSVGRPTSQFLYQRVKDVESARSSTIEADLAAWRAWTARHIGDLSVELLPRLGFNRPSSEQRIASLRKLASVKNLKRSDVIEFLHTLGLVTDALSSVEASAIDAVLARFAGGRIKLAELTDDELAMLRSEKSLMDQLFVQLA